MYKSHLYLLSVWGMTKQGCMIHYRASTFFFLFFFAFSPKIHLPLPRSWIHACCYKMKKRIDFSLNMVVIFLVLFPFSNLNINIFFVCFIIKKIQVHLLILGINDKWMDNQLFHLMAWSDFRWSISVAMNITMMLSWQIIQKNDMFIQPKIVF